jgi:hypothetical protein
LQDKVSVLEVSSFLGSLYRGYHRRGRDLLKAEEKYKRVERLRVCVGAREKLRAPVWSDQLVTDAARKPNSTNPTPLSSCMSTIVGHDTLHDNYTLGMLLEVIFAPTKPLMDLPTASLYHLLYVAIPVLKNNCERIQVFC